MAWDIVVKTKVYHLLANEIFFRIYNGTYPPGAKLSSFPVFAKEVGSSPETVRKAISELQMHGIVERNRLGYFVTSNHFNLLIRPPCIHYPEVSSSPPRKRPFLQKSPPSSYPK